MSTMGEQQLLAQSERSSRRWTRGIGPLVCLLAYVALAIVDVRNGTLRAEQTPTTIVWYTIAFTGFGTAVWSNERRAFSWRWLWLFAIVFRLVMLTTTPTLSDDVYRYLWDGHLVAEGVNPYTHEINAPELDPFEIPARRLANNPTLSSPYLPVAHGIFGTASTFTPSEPLSMQILMTLFDLGSAVVISRLLVAAGLPASRVLLYLWNPLIIIETAHGAHLDAVMIFLALLALLGVFGRGRGRTASPVALALASLTRPIPILLAPIIWWRWTARQRALLVITAIAIIIPFGFGPAGFGLIGEATGTGVFGSARVYSQEFRFNAGVAHWMENSIGTAAANFAVITLMSGTLLAVSALARNASDDTVNNTRRLLRLASVATMAYVLLTPILHPWYLSILIALLVFVPPAPAECGDRWLLLAPWMWLATTLPLSYLTYRDPNAFGELSWVRTVEWYPALALLVGTSFWVFFAVQAEPAHPAQPSVGDTGSS